MRKFLFSAFVMLIGLSAFAQEEAVVAKQAPAVKAKKVVMSAEQEAQKLVDMMSQSKDYTEAQKQKIHEVALNTVKKREEIASLKKTDPDGYAKKEMTLFMEMSEKIKEIESGN